MGNLVLERTNSEHPEREYRIVGVAAGEKNVMLRLLRDYEAGSEDLTYLLKLLLSFQGAKKEMGVTRAELLSAHDEIKRQEADRARYKDAPSFTISTCVEVEVDERVAEVLRGWKAQQQ